MKYCRDCVHAHRPKKVGCTYCNRPVPNDETAYMITGNKKQALGSYAHDERYASDYSDRCGPDAKYYRATYTAQLLAFILNIWSKV